MNKRTLLERRQRRTRSTLKAAAKGLKPRLSVFRSNNHIYAQIIDDVKGLTLVSASTLDKELRSRVKKGWDVSAAETVGQMVAEKAKSQGIKTVVFDRGPYLYHGRVKALAMSARANGLEF